jgi:polar amino acid transport system substrate-binding protein
MMTKLLITRRRAAMAAMALASPGLLAARPAQANNLEKAQRAGELLIATELHFAPFDFTEGGRQVGMNSELFAEVGKALNLRIRFQDLPWPGASTWSPAPPPSPVRAWNATASAPRSPMPRSPC